MDATASFALQSRNDYSRPLYGLQDCNTPGIFSPDPVTNILEIVRMSLGVFNTRRIMRTSISSQFSEVRFSSVAFATPRSVTA